MNFENFWPITIYSILPSFPGCTLVGRFCLKWVFLRGLFLVLISPILPQTGVFYAFVAVQVSIELF